MKDIGFLYKICIFVVFGTLIVLTWSIVDMPPIQLIDPQQQAVEKTTHSIEIQDKNCECCSKQMSRFREQIRNAHERKVAKALGSQQKADKEDNTP